MAGLCYEICAPIAKKKTLSKLKEKFGKKVLELERNLILCCDPEVKNYHSIFRKNYYELPHLYLAPSKGKDSKSKSIADSEVTKTVNTTPKMSKKNMGTMLDKDINFIQNATADHKAAELRKSN